MNHDAARRRGSGAGVARERRGSGADGAGWCGNLWWPVFFCPLSTFHPVFSQPTPRFLLRVVFYLEFVPVPPHIDGWFSALTKGLYLQCSERRVHVDRASGYVGLNASSWRWLIRYKARLVESKDKFGWNKALLRHGEISRCPSLRDFSLTT